MAPKKPTKPRGKGKPFPKGKSGNPAGRPPLSLEERAFRELCREKSTTALERIEKIAKKGTGMTAFKANEYIVDRGYGRPKQELDLGAGGARGGLVIMLPPLAPEE